MAGKQLNTVRIIPNADPMLLKNLDVRPGDKSLGIFTTDCDDVSYTAVDEATGGTGLGLAIVKHIVAQHGAKLSLESEAGKGTEIRVDFSETLKQQELEKERHQEEKKENTEE